MEEKKKVVEKKSIVPRTAVKALINGFVAYGILLIFIFLTIAIFTTWLVDNNRNVVNYDVLKYTLPLMAAILIFFLVRGTCRLSTYDLFKNCKIEKKEVDNVCTKMNFFYICLVAFSVATIIIYMITRFSNERIQITRDLMFYNQSNSIYAEEKEEELIEEYEMNKANTLVQTLIVEMGLLLGIFSLIPNQRRLIERYN
ncbi:MAG: hypothetical protein IJ629_00760 [Clostridia bacterium]|nr:hypothetical protein [Clostridia bacterium]